MYICTFYNYIRCPNRLHHTHDTYIYIYMYVYIYIHLLAIM